MLLDVIGMPPAMRAELYPGDDGAAIAFTKTYMKDLFKRQASGADRRDARSY
jgi:hypothetical protein